MSTKADRAAIREWLSWGGAIGEAPWGALERSGWLNARVYAIWDRYPHPRTQRRFSWSGARIHLYTDAIQQAYPCPRGDRCLLYGSTQSGDYTWGLSELAQDRLARLWFKGAIPKRECVYP